MRIVSWVVAAAALAGCGGRATLGPESGQAWRRMFEVQTTARPSKAVAPMWAEGAKIAIDNYYPTFRAKDAGRPNAAGAFGAGTVLSSGTGLLTPVSPNILSDVALPGGDGPPIRLQAK